MIAMRSPALVLAVACGGGNSGATIADAAAADAAPPAACEVGTGYEGFVPLAENGDVQIVSGPQGGYHIFTSVRVGRFDVATTTARVTIRPAGGGAYVGPTATAHGNWAASGDGWSQAIGLFNFVEDPASIRDRAIVIRAEASDDHGARAVDERTVTAR